MGRKILAIDYDGTCVDESFPEVGTIKPLCVEVLKELKKQGWTLVLWTCREDYSDHNNRPYLTEAVEYMKSLGVEFASINENLPHQDFRNPQGNRRKVFADIYLDDRAIGGFPGWHHVAVMLLGHSETTPPIFK